MLTTVTDAPSPTLTSTLAAYCALPTWSSTTVADACGATSTTTWPYDTPPVPLAPTTIASDTSPATVTTSASVALAIAIAESRSKGVCTAPTRGSDIGTTSTGAFAAHEYASGPSAAGPANRCRSRGSAANRQSSCRDRSEEHT